MISLKNITVKIGQKTILDNITVDFSKASCWIIAGTNGSGKSFLGKIIGGLVEPWKGEIKGCAVTGYTSFELQEKVMEEEKKKDMSRLMNGAVDEGTKVLDFLFPETDSTCAYSDELLKIFSVSHLLKRGLRFLSSGEFRKVLLLSALLKKPDLLVIDDPYDGLDSDARKHLKDLVNKLIKKGNRLILISGRIEDFPGEASGMLILSKGKAVYCGNSEKGAEIYKQKYLDIYADADKNLQYIRPDKEEDTTDKFNAEGHSKSDKKILIKMVNTSVSYSGRKVIDKINWTVRQGEKWKITGANGSGKSTLLSLVNGDNPQAYINDITLFGKKRGTGESVWDIKKKTGFVSGDFQLGYRVRCSLLDAVISGLHDSVGLYKNPNESDIYKADKWLKFTGLYSKRNSIFTDLSFGEMRLALIARAMIKNPELLILDEPCQGLDSFNRTRVIDLCERIGKDNKNTILFVTHDSEVDLKCFTNFLMLEKKF